MTMRIACFLAVFLLGHASASAASFQEDFQSFPGSKWSVMGGQWSTEGGILQVEGGSGPKAMLKDVVLGDFQLDVEIRLDTAGAQAGVVFRAEGVEEGIDAFRGYFAGLHADKNVALWGVTNPGWKPIAFRPVKVDSLKWYHLRIRAAGDNVKVYIDEKPLTEESYPIFDGVDPSFKKGSLALRALDGKASFRNFRLGDYAAPKLAASYTNPVQGGAADPVVLQHGGKFYAYCTYTPDFPNMPKGIRLYVSDDLVKWKDEGYVLKNEDSWGDSRFWAPDIVEKDGIFYLYYAADERMCVATAKSPKGPFKQQEQKPIEPASIRIDGHLFQDDDGETYFYYVTFGQGNEIWGGKLNDDMASVDQSSLRLMVKPDEAWERHQWPVTEGPVILKHKGVYYLTYSGSHFENPEYAMGYATSDSPLGPWKKYEFNPVMKSTSYAHGTAHHCFTKSPDGKETFIVYHRHFSLEKTEPRQLAVDRVRFVSDEAGGPDVLEVHGPTSSPQPMPSGSR